MEPTDQDLIKKGSDSIISKIVIEEETDTLSLIYPLIYKDVYRIAYILPLYLHEIYQDEFVQNKTSKAAQSYYMGVKMALEDSVVTYGINIDAHVFDNSLNYDSVEHSVLDKVMQDSFDMIVGPFTSEHMNEYNSFSRLSKTPLVSPINIKEEFLLNPYFISCRPTINTLKEKSLELLQSNFKNFNIILLCQNDKEVSVFKEILQKANNSNESKSIHLLVVNHENWEKAGYLSLLQKDSNLVMVLSSDLVVINSVVTNLSGRIDIESEKDDTKITLLAPYSWLNNLAVELVMLENLNTHFLSEPMLDYDDSINIEFIEKYREMYRTEPDNYAWLGYKSTIMYAQMIIKTGKYFQRGLLANHAGNDEFQFICRRNMMGFEKSDIWLFRFEDHKVVRVKEIAGVESGKE
ncbi:hypothetical protein ACFLRI_04070 [Bacteroidota bacterium]